MLGVVIGLTLLEGKRGAQNNTQKAPPPEKASRASVSRASLSGKAGMNHLVDPNASIRSNGSDGGVDGLSTAMAKRLSASLEGNVAAPEGKAARLRVFISIHSHN